MTKYSKDILDKAINHGKKILNIYNELINAEAYYQKETDYYLELVNKLSKAVDEEKAFYETLTPDVATYFLNQMFGSTFLSFDDYVNACFRLDEEKLVLTRVSFRLEEIIDARGYDDDEEESINSVVDADNTFELDPEDIEELVNAAGDIDYLNKLDRALEEDVINTIVFFINLYISNPKYNRINEFLIKYKYYLIFIFMDNEAGAIRKKFGDGGELYWGMRIIYDLENANDEDEYQEVKRALTFDLLYEHGEELLNTLFKEVEDEEYYAKAMFSQIVIRALSLFTTEVEFKEFANFLEEQIDTVDRDNYLIENIIRGAISKYEKDKEYPRSLSLREQKN